MKKTILALVLAAGLTSFAGSAKAVITYNFSLTGSKYGNFSGVLTTPSISDLGADSSVWWFNGHGYDYSATLVSASLNGTPFDLSAVDKWGDKAQGNQYIQFKYATAPTSSPMEQLLNESLFVVESPTTSYSLASVSAAYGNVVEGANPALVFHNIPGNYAWPTSVVDGKNDIFTLTYVSDGTAAVPEPSQVAASLLLAAGITGFVIVKRRQEDSDLEALVA